MKLLSLTSPLVLHFYKLQVSNLSSHNNFRGVIGFVRFLTYVRDSYYEKFFYLSGVGF